MLFLSFSTLWSFSYFFILVYLTLLISLVFYMIPLLSQRPKYNLTKFQTTSHFITGPNLYPMVLCFYMFMLFTNFLWSSPVMLTWFGHIIFSYFQYKMIYLLLLFFLMVELVMFTTKYFSSSEVFDFIIVTFGFFYWLSVLFFSNSLFTAIFMIEVLSALTFLFLMTSAVSTAFYYRNTDFSAYNFFQKTTPYVSMTSIIFFFWVSLLASLTLFLTIILIYTKLLTMDWLLLDHVFSYIIEVSYLKDLAGLGFMWFLQFFSIFLKCGMAPLYIWKPKFFKGMPMYTLLFYTSFFYFFIFLFFMLLVTTFLGTLFFYFTVINLVFMLTGLIYILFILCESYYLKAFMAMSSILNSLFVLVALSSLHHHNMPFWL